MMLYIRRLKCPKYHLFQCCIQIIVGSLLVLPLTTLKKQIKSSFANFYAIPSSSLNKMCLGMQKAATEDVRRLSLHRYASLGITTILSSQLFGLNHLKKPIIRTFSAISCRQLPPITTGFTFGEDGKT